MHHPLRFHGVALQDLLQPLGSGGLIRILHGSLLPACLAHLVQGLLRGFQLRLNLSLQVRSRIRRLDRRGQIRAFTVQPIHSRGHFLVLALEGLDLSLQFPDDPFLPLRQAAGAIRLGAQAVRMLHNALKAVSNSLGEPSHFGGQGAHLFGHDAHGPPLFPGVGSLDARIQGNDLDFLADGLHLIHTAFHPLNLARGGIHVLLDLAPGGEGLAHGLHQSVHPFPNALQCRRSATAALL